MITCFNFFAMCNIALYRFNISASLGYQKCVSDVFLFKLKYLAIKSERSFTYKDRGSMTLGKGQCILTWCVNRHYTRFWNCFLKFMSKKLYNVLSMENTYQFFNNKEHILSKQINQRGTYICAQAWIFFKPAY